VADREVRPPPRKGQLQGWTYRSAIARSESYPQSGAGVPLPLSARGFPRAPVEACIMSCSIPCLPHRHRTAGLLRPELIRSPESIARSVFRLHPRLEDPYFDLTKMSGHRLRAGRESEHILVRQIQEDLVKNALESSLTHSSSEEFSPCELGQVFQEVPVLGVESIFNTDRKKLNTPRLQHSLDVFP